MALSTILTLSLLLALTSFGIGILPLFFTFSRKRLAQLSTYGTGLLLGAALGIIIPEGIEAIYDSKPSFSPTLAIALSLLGGFTLMLIVEQFLSPHSHSDDSTYVLASTNGDVQNHQHNVPKSGAGANTANPITFGLVIHSLADGLALGASSLPSPGSDTDSNNSLTWVVFFALLIHKAPTSLALCTSLLPHLSRPQIRTHIAIFSLASPLGAVVSYLALSYTADASSWAGIALAFSGGTFLYVATVLTPIRDDEEHTGTGGVTLTKVGRAALIIAGMFTPLAIATMVGHSHGHGVEEAAHEHSHTHSHGHEH